MAKVRYGVIGLGNMGSQHSQYLFDNAIEGATLGAICDIDPEKLKKYSDKFPGWRRLRLPRNCSNPKRAMRFLWPCRITTMCPSRLDAFSRNIHVLLEKPLAVSVHAGRQCIEGYKKYPHLKFGIMLNQRNSVLYQKMREMISAGELGQITRITWICTNWFRSFAYYASGGWRATWKGEGGGVLLNQCPHYLDLVQWIPNLMPNRVTAVAYIGKTHPIEVEDEVSAIMEYPNGVIGHFITSTGEAPGANRLEICGGQGKLVAEDGKLKFIRNRIDAQEWNRTTPTSFGIPETWNIDVATPPRSGSEHQMTTQNFTNIIVNNLPNEQLLAPGPDGFNGLELGNAIMMAGLSGKPVDLPVNGPAYDQFIEDLAKKYGGRKTLQTKTGAGQYGEQLLSSMYRLHPAFLGNIAWRYSIFRLRSSRLTTHWRRRRRISMPSGNAPWRKRRSPDRSRRTSCNLPKSSTISSTCMT